MRQFTLVISYTSFLIIFLELRDRTTFELESYAKRVRSLLFIVHPNYSRESQPEVKNLL